MNGLNLNIKKLRKNFPYTQEEMADKLNLSLGAYKKIENGVTKLDIDRLNQIANILETSLIELLSFTDGIYIEQIVTNKGAISANEFHLHDSENTKELYEQIINLKNELLKSKDEIIKGLNLEINFLKRNKS